MEYLAEDLVREAHERGFKEVKPRLVVDWVQLGLLDKPTKTGRGKGGGRGTKKGVWPQHQADLFFSLLDQHRRQAKRIPTLCNIPVFVWLWWGDEFVPVRQVHRAMLTYAGAYRRSSATRARYSGREVARDLGSPGGSREQRRFRQFFVEAAAQIGREGQLSDADRANLIDLARRVF